MPWTCMTSHSLWPEFRSVICLWFEVGDPICWCQISFFCRMCCIMCSRKVSCFGAWAYHLCTHPKRKLHVYQASWVLEERNSVDFLLRVGIFPENWGSGGLFQLQTLWPEERAPKVTARDDPWCFPKHNHLDLAKQRNVEEEGWMCRTHQTA